MPAASIAPALLRAYLHTTYHAAGWDVRIGRPPPAALLARLQSHSGVFMTAWNPLSRRMPAGWNHRAQRHLTQYLRRFETLHGHGTLDLWSEAHLLIAGDPRRVIRLARRFRQRAVVVLQGRRNARLVLLSFNLPGRR